MPATTQLKLKLDFNQVLDLVLQLPKEQRQQLAGILDQVNTPPKNFTLEEKAFLKDLDGAVDFVNKYPKDKAATNTFKQMLDAL